MHLNAHSGGAENERGTPTMHSSMSRDGTTATPGPIVSARAGSSPEDSSSPPSFHGNATMKMVPLIPLCLVSTLPLLAAASTLFRRAAIKAPVVAANCRTLFGGREGEKGNEDNARWKSAQRLCLHLSSFSSPVLLCRALAGE